MKNLSPDILSSLKEIKQPYSQGLLLSTARVYELYKSLPNQLDFPLTPLLLPEGEEAKNLHVAEKCWETMVSHGFDKQSVVIALGGGSVTDLGGFVASCYMRGIDSVYFPTTLLGMVDAAVGGKTGVNFKQFKNYIGTFHFPRVIVIDPTCLQTLPKKEFASGLAEVIKYGMIHSSSLFEKLEKHIEELPKNEKLLEEIIRESIAIKCHVVESDPYNQGERDILNYGHTFGHALESMTNFQEFTHGEAIAIGMACAAHLSHQMGILEDANVVDRQNNLLQRAGLPTQFPDLDQNRFIQLMKSDKKTMANKINLILPVKIGKVIKVSNVDPILIQQSLSHDERTRRPTSLDTPSSFWPH